MKKNIFLILFTICLKMSSFSFTTVPSFKIFYSKNKNFKVVVSPKFCNDSICLSFEDIDSLGSKIKPEFLTESITIYKHVKDEYKLYKKLVVNDNLKSIDIDKAKYFISNDGNFIIVENSLNFRWQILDISGNEILQKSVYGESEFDVNIDIIRKYLNDLLILDSKSELITNLNKNKLIIKVKYFDLELEHYKIYKKQIIIHKLF